MKIARETHSSLLKHPALYTDFYELTMAQGYFLAGRAEEQACFDYFFRDLPFKGGYVIFAGIGDLLEILQNFSFGQEELSYLEGQGFRHEFLEYLRNFELKATIYSMREGEVL